MGIVFLVLYSQGALPGVFAIPARWGDMALGMTAPLLAWFWKPPFSYKTAILWNVLGILELVKGSDRRRTARAARQLANALPRRHVVGLSDRSKWYSDRCQTRDRGWRTNSAGCSVWSCRL